MKSAAIAAALLFFAVQPSAHEVFLEDFSEGLDPKRWIISDWTAPHNSATNKARFKPEHVKIVGGLLRLELTQEKNEDGTISSYGGEIKSVAKFGYGTYRFSIKSSSNEPDWPTPGDPVSGSITGAFSYLEGSKTEIDIEMEGVTSRAALTLTSTWTDENTKETIKTPPFSRFGDRPHQRFHNYSYVWTPEKVEFFRDGEPITVHRKVVPREPAHFIFNHWGTDSEAWGGKATPGVRRYVYVRNFSFTPLEK